METGFEWKRAISGGIGGKGCLFLSYPLLSRLSTNRSGGENGNLTSSLLLLDDQSCMGNRVLEEEHVVVRISPHVAQTLERF